MSFNDRICCEEHPDARLLEDLHTGDMICPECGTVIGDRLICVYQGGRNFHDDDGQCKDNSRVGADHSPFSGESGLTTRISDWPKVQGNRPTTSRPERNRWATKSTLGEIASKFHFANHVLETSMQLFEEARKVASLKRKDSVAIGAACMFLACRQEKNSRSMREISAISKASLKDVGKCLKLILRDVDPEGELKSPRSFIARFCSQLKLPYKIERAAQHICEKTKELNVLMGRNNTTMAAASIYMASQASENQKTHREIADVAGVADITIRQAYKIMYKRRAELFPANYEFSTLIESMPKC